MSVVLAVVRKASSHSKKVTTTVPESHGTLLTIMPCKIKMKRQITYFQHVMAQDYLF